MICHACLIAAISLAAPAAAQQALDLPPPPPPRPLQLPGAPPIVDPHAGMDHGEMDHGAPAPNIPPPAQAFEGPLHAADAIWGVEQMARARAQSRVHHGAMTTGMILLERLEARLSRGHDAYLWDAQGWYGGDIDRFVLKSEGKGEVDGRIEDADVQALWSRAIGPFFDLQAGVKLDFEPQTRSHFALGVRGLAPYMWHVDGAIYLSDRGDVTTKAKAEYDQKITQSLILQPRIELELAAQDVPERGIGPGLVKAEAGLRLRYEIIREFAPYVGVEYEAKLGETADIARALGEDSDGLALVLGLRAWF